MYKMCFRVGQTEVDSYNIVHHPEYVKWAEKAFCEYMINNGNPTPKYDIVKFSTKHIKPALVYDEIVVRIRKINEIDDLTKVTCDILNLKNNALYCKVIFDIRIDN